MKFMNQARFYARRYRNEAAVDGAADGGAAVSGVQAETTEGSGTLLTADAEASAEGSEAAADAAAEGSTTEGDQGGDETGGEGSHTPPDTYADFALPEGMTVDAAALEEAAPLFKELGLNQEQAQKVVDFYAKQVQAGSQKQVDDFNQLMNDWRTQSQNDTEFGGEKFEQSVKTAQLAVSKFGTPELKQLLEDHGVGNHPEVVRFMVRVGEKLVEDVPGSGSATNQAADRVSILYPNDS